MTSNQEQMTEEQGMKIIHDMINKARFNFGKASFHFILWGFLLVAAAIYEYCILHYGQSKWAFVSWPVVGIVGGIASAVYGVCSGKGEPMTHLDRIYAGIWITYFATLFLFIVAAVEQEMNPGSYIMILTGLPTFLTGFVLRFRPLKIGGIGFWVLGFVSLTLFSDYSSLIFALSMVQGYLVPGFLMRNLK